MLTPAPDVTSLRQRFAWDIPPRFNVGYAVCDRVAETRPEALALIDVAEDETARHVTFGQLRDASNRLANALCGLMDRGDRIGVMLPQCTQTAVAHIAATKMGGVSIPLTLLFGPDALYHRIADAGARVLITTAAGVATLRAISQPLPDLRHVIVVGDPVDDCLSYDALCRDASDQFTALDTAADDPAFLIYTSGTTGNPKGALHGHRVLLGHLPGVEMSHDFLPQDGDRIWTPADWAWIGGLLDVLMPALYHGVPVVARRFRKFTADAAFRLMRDHGVRNAFLPPTALKLMRLDAGAEHYGLRLRSVASGGEPLGKELIDWGQRVFGATINEFYGQTECNMIVSSCAALGPPEPGVMGHAVPGHDVQVLGDTGPLPPGDQGDIAVRAPNPVMFLRYWNRPDATQAKYRTLDDGTCWLITGDQGVRTASGRICFVGRDDDIISSAGYRIGPSEIEDCLLTHPSVQLAGVVGMPDPLRGTIVAAYVQLAKGVQGSDALADEIAAHVKTRLAAYEAPRAIRFVKDMPMTTTGKIIRADLRQRAKMESGGHE